MVKYIIGILAIALSCFFSYDYGYSKAHNKQNEYYKEVIAQREKQYQELQSRFVLLNLEKENEIQAINAKLSAATISLQQRTKRDSISNPTNTTVIQTGTGSTGEQLFREDAEFLIGEAAKAEVLKVSLLNCRAQLEAVPKRD